MFDDEKRFKKTVIGMGIIAVIAQILAYGAVIAVAVKIITAIL